MAEDRAQAFLQLIRRWQRGRLKVYLGYGAGVGKTYRMLLEAHQLKNAGIDVVVGIIESHGRAETEKLVEGLEAVACRQVEYHGIVVKEMDLEAILQRHPQVALVDELAHGNIPGGRNSKRYQDVQDLLAAGIHVISALNIQHLESLYNTVEQLIGVKVRERLPDSALAEADQIVNVDLAAEDLQQRLREGKIYPADQTETALENFFTSSNLEHLRELTLRELASQLDFKRREAAPEREKTGSDGAPDQIMVCLSSGGPNSARLLRFGSRLAGRLNRNWYAVYVETPAEAPTVIDARTQRLLGDTLTLANQLGAVVLPVKGQHVADTILRFAREYRVGQIVIGRPRRLPWWKRLGGQRTIAEQLITRSRGVTVVVVDVESPEHAEPAEGPDQARLAVGAGTLSRLLTEDRIAIWEDPVTQADVRKRLVRAIVATRPELNEAAVARKLDERERLGSIFMNDGVALPHARLEELTSPQIALGLTHAGMLDAPTEKPIEAVFLLLSPASGSNIHLQLLAKVGRALQNRELRRALMEAKTPAEALARIEDFEAASSGSAAQPVR